MGASDPELRMRQLAQLRAAYEAVPRMADDQTRNRIARHSRVLLGRILAVLSAPHGGAGAPISRSNGKACADR